MSDAPCYYFGCWSGMRTGHHLYVPHGATLWEQSVPADFPVCIHTLDGGFLPPRQPETEGLATLIHVNGWTLVSFWDRSSDKRGKCNSAFLARGTLAFDELTALAKQHFPSIWQRFAFDVWPRPEPPKP